LERGEEGGRGGGRGKGRGGACPTNQKIVPALLAVQKKNKKMTSRNI